jgi:drug/metabolite transporter (DMT)-like permease
MNISSKKKILYADLALLVVTIIWGSGYIATKNTLDHIPPLYLSAMRFWIAFFIVGIISIKKLKHVKLKDIKGAAIVGLILYIAFASQTIGMQYTSVGKTAFLTGTNVVMVPFIYWAIFKDKPDKFSFIAVIICFVGIAILTLNEKLGSIGIGEGLTLLCAFFYACHIVFTDYYSKKIDIMILTAVQFGVVALLCSFTAIMYEQLPASIPTSSWMSIFYMGIFATCIAFFLQTLAQKYTYSTHAAIIISMEAVFGIIFSVIFLKESLTGRMILGCISIFLAIITAETRWEFINKKDNQNVELDIEVE